MTQELASLSGAAPLASHLSVAAVQYPIEPTKTLPQTLARVEDCVARARAGGADVVVLPELFVRERVSHAPGSASEAAQLERIAREETPALFDHVAELARRYELAVLGGTAPRVTGEGLVNTAILAFPSGRRVLQDKLFLTPDEVAWGWVRGEELRVFEAPWGRSAILICYDSQFSAVSSAIAPLAPELLFIPSMTTPKGLSRVRWSAQARAVEHHAYVVLTGAVAPERPALFTGQAAILTPQDTGFPGVLVEGRENQAELVFGTLDLARLRDSRDRAGLYSARDAQRRDRPLRVVSE